MSIQDQVDRLIDTRPGKELLSFAHDERAFRDQRLHLPLGGHERELPARDERRAA